MTLKLTYIAVSQRHLEAGDNPDLFGIGPDGTVYEYVWTRRRWVPLPMTTDDDPLDPWEVQP